MRRSLGLIAGTILAVSVTVPWTGSFVALADDGGQQSWSNTSTTNSTTLNSGGSYQKDGTNQDDQGDNNDEQGSDGDGGQHTVVSGSTIQSVLSKDSDGNDTENIKDYQSENSGQQNTSGDKSSEQKTKKQPQSGTDKTSSTSAQADQLKTLHSDLAQFHKDIQAAHAAHLALVGAVHDFTNAMQDAVNAGAANAVSTYTTQAQGVVTTLKTALQAQASADANVKQSTDSQQKGDLSQAIAAITAADKREQAKTTAMQKATAQLENFAQAIELAAATAETSATASGGNSTNTVGNTVTNTVATQGQGDSANTDN